MRASKETIDAIKETIECLKKGEYEAAGGKLFFLWENLESEVTDPVVRGQAVALVNKATSLIIGEDPYDFSAEMNVYKLGASGLADAVFYLESLLQILG